MQKPELKFKSAGLLTCAVLALGSIGFAGAAVANSDTAAEQAATPTAQASPYSGAQKMHRRGHHAMRGHHHHRIGKAALLVPGYGPVPQDVVDSLSLTAQQSALLDDAKSFIKEQRQSRGDKYKAKRRDGATPIATPLDPHAALERRDERFSAMQEIRSQANRKWLAVWDSLDSKQQQTVSDYVVERSQERAERAANHREKREARRTNKS